MAGMRMVFGFVLIALAYATPAIAKSGEPSWKPISTLQGPDRKLAERIIEDDLNSGFEGKRARVALIQLPDARNLLFLETAQLGNCGRYELRIFGPASSGVARQKLIELCLSNLSLRRIPGQTGPDLVVDAGDLTADVYHWKSEGWAQKPEVVEALSTSNALEGPRLEVKRYRPLLRYVGTYNAASILRVPEFRKRLRSGLGDRYLTLLSNLGVRGPWDYVGGCLITSGQRPHEGDEEGIVAVCLDTGDVHAAIRDQGQWTLLSAASEFQYVPHMIRTFLTKSCAPPAPEKGPAGLTWIH